MDCIILCNVGGGGCAMHCEIFISILDIYPVHLSRPPSSYDNPECHQRLLDVPYGAKSLVVENLWMKEIPRNCAELI